MLKNAHERQTLKTSQHVQKAYQLLNGAAFVALAKYSASRALPTNATPSEIVSYRIPVPSPQINFFGLRVDKSIGDSP
jgi:hypothetical protein